LDPKAFSSSDVLQLSYSELTEFLTDLYDFASEQYGLPKRSTDLQFRSAGSAGPTRYYRYVASKSDIASNVYQADFALATFIENSGNKMRTYIDLDGESAMYILVLRNMDASITVITVHYRAGDDDSPPSGTIAFDIYRYYIGNEVLLVPVISAVATADFVAF
jgi:hypothetical protein